MPKEVRLIATKDIPGIKARLADSGYRTRRLKAGDEFFVSEVMADLMVNGLKRASHTRPKANVPAPPARVVERANTQTPADDFLDRAIPAIAKDMPGLDTSDLRRHLSAEKRGKGRKGLITAFEAELEARKG
jgi:methyl coenzyme M reductase subunit C-like uncharacterized protein (methanogenesis marker protein 7)